MISINKHRLREISTLNKDSRSLPVTVVLLVLLISKVEIKYKRQYHLNLVIIFKYFVIKLPLIHSSKQKSRMTTHHVEEILPMSFINEDW